MKVVIESNDLELDADRNLIEKLRAEKRELQEKIDALNAEVKVIRGGLRTPPPQDHQVPQMDP